MREEKRYLREGRKAGAKKIERLIVGRKSSRVEKLSSMSKNFLQAREGRKPAAIWSIPGCRTQGGKKEGLEESKKKTSLNEEKQRNRLFWKPHQKTS